MNISTKRNNMIQEDKQLLLKDLCTRLPYSVKVSVDYIDEASSTETLNCLHIIGLKRWDGEDGLIDIKPYLRPMSSMTEEEFLSLQDMFTYKNLEYNSFIHKFYTEWKRNKYIPFYIYNCDQIDYLISHFFDYRGLIEKGLAIEAPKDMYTDNEEDTDPDVVPCPEDLDDAFTILDYWIADEDKEYLLKEGPIAVHHTLGKWIRNNFGLWEGSHFKDYLENLHLGLNHPDDMSHYVIEKYIEYLKNK